jgi:hypothetical protein
MVKTKKERKKKRGPQNLETLKFSENLEAPCRRTFGTCAPAIPGLQFDADILINNTIVQFVLANIMEKVFATYTTSVNVLIKPN